jgi:peptidoglycan LD-endopeptidase LytH
MRGSRVHNALDIMAPRGTPVLSADAGTLLKFHNSVPGGLTAYASDPTRHFVFLYGHLDSYNPLLKEGQALARGDTIGFVGSTGNAAAAGPHLHFGITRNTDIKKWWSGTPIDPRPLLR